MEKISCFNKKKNLVYGFTLIELLVVISIIALLSSVIMSAFGTANQRGRDTAKINALQEVRSALQLYVTDQKSYPANTAALVPKYIASINPNVKYEGLNSNNTAVCGTAPCQSYHLAVALEGKDNKVLTTDKNLNLGGTINGTVDNCGSEITASTPNLCYDVTP